MTGDGDMREGAGAESDEGPDAARAVLAERLRSAWEASESKLPLDRLEAKLKERLRGQNVKGLGRSSVARYMDRGHTTLPDKRDAAPDSPVGVSASAATGPGPLPAAAVTPTPSGVEKGSLGEDSRCGALLKGPRAVVWRVCARVEQDRVSFALKIINGGQAATKVKIRLEYAQATEFHRCPNTSGAQVLNIPAGQTLLTDPGQCATPREDVPFAYQGVGWVLPEDANAGSYELSPTAHVYPNRVIWKPNGSYGTGECSVP
ncbi:hypothetical protein [Streptomyces sp. NPDC097981]|uniref:hypothetical protein n=1 Tax=Streptomyces sp. NPDC097981 TaxID=3155428 RepID=UPI00333193E7